VDENLHEQGAVALRAEGHDALTIVEQGLFWASKIVERKAGDPSPLIHPS
jgi:hypothetical protein